VPVENVISTLQVYLGSSFVNLLNRFNQVFQVYIQAGGQYRLNPRDIEGLYARNRSGAMVPLGRC
jgi:hydrophobic/amphiphilic exporter-1 (mainly G- bacteria), HAE1 family